MIILVTSSTDLTGKAAVKALAEKHIHVGAMFHTDTQKDETLSLSASETVITSIESEVDMRKAMRCRQSAKYWIKKPPCAIIPTKLSSRCLGEMELPGGVNLPVTAQTPEPSRFAYGCSSMALA